MFIRLEILGHYLELGRIVEDAVEVAEFIGFRIATPELTQEEDEDTIDPECSKRG